MKLVAVTSCPTGIAHSQMAAEGIEQAAEKLGYEIKVEIQGAMGAENELTGEDIAAADAVVIASDTSVNQDRFEGKPVVNAPVKDGINDAENLLRKAVEKADGDADAAAETEPVTESNDAAGDAVAEDDDSSQTSDADGSDRKGGSGGIVAKIKSLFQGAAEP